MALKTPESPISPLTHLSRDATLAAIISAVDQARFERGERPLWQSVAASDVGVADTRRTGADLFVDLIDAIVSQQLSVKAAATIMGRFRALFTDGRITPAAVLALEPGACRAAGLSHRKVEYVAGIATAAGDGSLALDALPELDDEQVIAALVALKGVGRWTAEMILMFSLRRPDVFSVGDLGLRTAVSRSWQVPRDDHAAIEAIAAAWSPWRTVASRYLWASLDNTPAL